MTAVELGALVGYPIMAVCALLLVKTVVTMVGDWRRLR